MTTLLAATMTKMLLGRADGNIETVDTWSDGEGELAFDGPIVVTRKVVPILDGDRLIETVVLQHIESFDAYVGFCRVRGRWFVLGVQGELQV